MVNTITPAEAGVYIEPQVQSHCLAHSLNAIVGRPIVGLGTNFFSDFLSRFCPPTAHDFTSAGWCTVHACNSFLWAHTSPPLHNTAFAPVWEKFGPSACSKQSVLGQAPVGCNALLVFIGMHYKAWLLRGTQWVEADSITCAASAHLYGSLPPHARPCIKVLRDADWAALGDMQGSVVVHALVRLDAFVAGLTVWPSPIALDPTIYARHLPFVDGATLHVAETIHRMPYTMAQLMAASPAPCSPRPAKAPRLTTPVSLPQTAPQASHAAPRGSRPRKTTDAAAPRGSRPHKTTDATRVPSADTAFALVHDLLGEPPSCSTQDWTPPPHDVHNTIASAVAFQEHFADHMPTLVCAVCAKFCCPADVDRVAIDRLPHVHLLRADGPKTPSTPRHRHTTVRIADIVYCLHPNGVDRQHARVCKRCVCQA